MKQGCVGIKLVIASACVAAALLGSSAGMAWAEGGDTFWDGVTANYGQPWGIQVAGMLGLSTGRQAVVWTEEDVQTAEMNTSDQASAVSVAQSDIRVSRSAKKADGLMQVHDRDDSAKTVIQVEQTR